MNLSVESILKNSFVVSIDKSRYSVFCKRFNDAKLNPLPKLYDGFQIKNGIYKEIGLIKTKNICNCFLSHIALVKMAKILNLPFITIFEDDALPTKHNAIDRIQQCLNEIPDDCDMIKLGYITIKNKQMLKYKSICIADTLGSHAYVIFNTMYDKYVELANTNITIDLISMNDPGSKIYTVVSPLFIQFDDEDCNYTTLHNNINHVNYLKSIYNLEEFGIYEKRD